MTAVQRYIQSVMHTDAIGGETFRKVLNMVHQPLSMDLILPGFPGKTSRFHYVKTQYIFILEEPSADPNNARIVRFAEIHFNGKCGKDIGKYCRFLEKYPSDREEHGIMIPENERENLSVYIWNALTGGLSSEEAEKLQLKVEISADSGSLLFGTSPVFIVPEKSSVELKKTLCQELEGFPGVGKLYFEAEADYNFYKKI